MRYPGLRLLRRDRWECLVSYLCSGTNGVRGIRSNVEKIARLSRGRVILDGEERYVFPTPIQAVEERLYSLKDLGLDRARNIFVMILRMVNDSLLLYRTAGLESSVPEAVRLLDSYRGIDPKIAGYAALTSLDKLVAFPVDRWVLRGPAHCDPPAIPATLAETVAGQGTLTQAQQYRVA